MKRTPKPRPPMSFVDLERAVKHYEGSDRTDKTVASRANQILHDRYAGELAQRKMAQGKRMAEAIKQAGYKG